MMSARPTESVAFRRVARRAASRARGYTLLELMIALVVIAILATIAYPQYTEFVQRSRIVDATSTLNDLRVRMEQAFQDNRSFAAAGNCAINPTMPAYDATRDNFQFTCGLVAGAMGGYQLDAIGNATKGMGSFQYRLLVDGDTGALTRSTVGVPASWNPLPAPNTCWQVRKAGKCS